MIRKLIPSAVKREIRIAQRKIADRKKGYLGSFAKVAETTPKIEDYQKVTAIEQPIFYNPLAANKVFNIQLAIDEIHKVIIKPEQYFSFWHIVGKPTVKKGYKTGRNIIGDHLQEDIGGGLCQVSGMIYHLALVSGMEIIERFNHTLDLYTEDKRYTPLGADATVVYGYKDIRFKNCTNSPVIFKFEVSETRFKGNLYATNNLPAHEIVFERQEFEGYRTIETFRKLSNDSLEHVNNSKYILA